MRSRELGPTKERKGRAPAPRWESAARAALGIGALLAATAACGAEGRGGPPEDAAQEAALRAAVSELLPAVERHSGLRAVRPPELATADRERLDGYLLARFEEQLPPERAEAIEAVYARLGLIPDTLDLRATLLELYREQVVGFYDPRTDTLFVLREVPEDQLEMVLVHELVHALQDQHVDLDSLARAVEGDNDRSTAFQAAVEGHATLAMLAWQLSRMTGREVDLEALRGLGERLAGLDLQALGGAAGLGAVARVPRVIREALLFPYVGGLTFTQRLWSEREGRPAPFGPHLPASTEQVIHPERLLSEPVDPPSRVRFETGPPEGRTEVYADGLGELEIRLFLEEHLGDPARAADAAAGWDGDRYRLLRGPEGEALVWATVWDDVAEAGAFAAAAREAFGRRYTGAADRSVTVETLTVDGRPSVLILDLPDGLEPDPGWAPASFRVEGG